MKKSWLVLLAVVVSGYFFIEDVWPQLQVAWLKGRAATAQQQAAIQIGVTVPSVQTTLTSPTPSPVLTGSSTAVLQPGTPDPIPLYDSTLSIQATDL